jgi:hypothetical protein
MQSTKDHPMPSADHRLLIVLNETLEARALAELVEHARRGSEVLVVAPALNTRLRHWMSDEDPARAAAQARPDDCLAALAAAGMTARGRLGNTSPVQAIDDALSGFGADEILVVAQPEERANWLARDLVPRVRARLRAAAAAPASASARTAVTAMAA